MDSNSKSAPQSYGTMDRSLNFSKGPKKGDKNSPSMTRLPRSKCDEAQEALTWYTDQPGVPSLNVTYCLHHYPTALTVPSPNNPPIPLDSLLHLESSLLII